MKRAAVESLFIFNLVLAFPALVLYIVGFASHTWLELNFELPPQPPTILVNIPVEANMGLYTACKRIHYPSPSTPGERIVEECSPDGAADWQFVACGLAIGGLVLCFTGVLLAFVYICCCRRNCCKIVIFCCNVFSAGLMVAPLLMYAINRKFQVKPPLPYIYDFHLAWGYYVSAASACLVAIVALLNMVEIVWSTPCKDCDNSTSDYDQPERDPIANGLSKGHSS